MEYCKNELNLNDKQTSSVLDMFWSLLEFDPDEKAIEKDVDMKALGEASDPLQVEQQDITRSFTDNVQ